MTEGRSLIWVMLGGALGASARYLVGGWALRRFGVTFPWGTFLINISGCLLLGFFAGVRGEGRWAVPTFLTPGFGIGFLGAYTTFSTFAVETVNLLELRSVVLAAAYVGGSVAVGVLAAGVGTLLGRQV